MPEAIKERVAQNVVTPDNLTSFNLKHLRMEEPAPMEAKKEEPKQEEKKEEPKAEEKKAEEPKKEEPKKGHPIQERFSEMAEQRKAAEAKAKAEAERADKAEREAAELREKLKPVPVPDEIGPEPKLADFENDAEKWFAAKFEWKQKKTDKERAEAQAKSAAEQQARDFYERVQQAKAEIPDFQEKIDANKGVNISEDMKQAIITSDMGPRILYYFADHPEEAIRIGKLSPYRQVAEIGKLELSVMPKNEEKKEEPEEKPKAEISKAPAPIEPLRAGAGAEVVGAEMFEEQATAMRYQSNPGDAAKYRALRKAGKIK